MTHYIDKSALVAEIDKLQSEIAEEKKLHEDNSMWYNGINHGFNLTKDILNTLEVKEVDLDEKSVTPIDVTRFYNDGLRCGVEAFARIVRTHLCEMTADSLIQFRNEYRKLTGDEMFGAGKD